MSNIFFDGWDGIIRVLVGAPVMYVTVIIFIRISGKRSTSQMNSFDWIVTVALGSIVAAGVLQSSISLAEALLAIALLLLLQWLVTELVVHSDAVSDLVKAEPRLLVDKGHYLDKAMRDERVTRSEVRSALRNAGLTEVDEAQWVILETDATISVIPKGEHDFSDVDLDGVAGSSSMEKS